MSLHGRPLNLTRREFGLLADLLRHRGRIRSRDDLLGAVWGTDSDSTDRTVDTHIKTLARQTTGGRAGVRLRSPRTAAWAIPSI